MRHIRFLIIAAAVPGLAASASARVLSVTPQGNWERMIGLSAAGDTIKFAAGKYVVSHKSQFPPRIYAGDKGAVFGGANEITFTGSDVSGFTFDGIPLELSGAGDNFHGNTFTGNATLTLNQTCSDTKIIYNTFATTSNHAIRGYPRDNITIEYNSVDLTGVTISGNDNNEEWLHLVSRNKGLSVSHNVITAGLMRWAIELQSGMQNLKIQGNYIHATKGGGGISCATGGDPAAPFRNQGQNIDISGNTILTDTTEAVGCALEIMGDKNIQIHDNFLGNFGTGILNGTGGDNNQGLITATNTIIYAEKSYSDGDNTPWPVPHRVSTGDKIFKVGDASAPPAPDMPTKVGAAADGSPGPHSDNSTPDVPPSKSALSAVATAHTLTLTWAAQSAPVTLEIRPTDAAVSMEWETAAQVAAGGTNALIASYRGQPLNQVATQTWKYDVRLTCGSIAETITAQCLSSDNATTPAAQNDPTLTEDIAQLAADEARIAADLARLQQHQQAGAK